MTVEELVRRWVGEARCTPVDAMNSRVWRVTTAGATYYAKLAPTEGLAAARHLAAKGFRSGEPLHVGRCEEGPVALLAEVAGRPLTWRDDVLIGATLRRAHELLADLAPPPQVPHWPWEWLRPDRIPDADARAAAERALDFDTSDLSILHGDPAPEAFLELDGDVGLIDWGSALVGPRLYDVASALMYADAGVLDGYGDVTAEEIDPFLRLRFAVQASYFAERIARGDTTGTDAAGNRKGYDDGRRMLLAGIERGGRVWGAPR